MRTPATLRVLAVLSLSLSSSVAAAAAAEPAVVPIRVSVSSAELEADGASAFATVSGNGDHVVFESEATDLVAGDDNGQRDVFWRDLGAGTTRIVSIGTDGERADGPSFWPVVSADGRYVAFDSGATNLVPGDTNGANDVFVRDRTAGTTERISVGPGGVQGNRASISPAITPDGRYVAFRSSSSNLVADDSSPFDVFVHDRDTGVTDLVSTGPGGRPSNGQSSAASISADGRFVVFRSNATNLVRADTNGVEDAFVHDRLGGTTRRLSVSSTGEQGDRVTFEPEISANGRYVVYRSGATNLVASDANDATDIFLRDRRLGTTERVSVGSDETQGDGTSLTPAVSADGRFVAFVSAATNLVAADRNGERDVFLRDRVDGTTQLVSAGAGEGADEESEWPSLPRDGRSVAFASLATNLDPPDTNGVSDVFLHRLAGG